MRQKTQRLDKFISHTTGLTRGQVKQQLALGEVTVNGLPVKQASMGVSAEDQVCWQGERLEEVGLRYLLLNKPLGYECSRKSSHHPLVFDLIDLPLVDRIQPVGRLDVETTGLLLLTDDGQWAHRLTSPRHKKKKIYRAELAEPLCPEAEARLAEGLLLEGEEKPTLPAELERLSPTSVKLGLTEGRYHQVRRMFAALGNHVVSLHRESIGDLVLESESCPEGTWRHLTAQEIQILT
ncbi:pseudouridine synthase [Marinospirillum sp.]|uniref:pseudouridine synthase n=1 Tax=Marinospirillum sp. TaxID=2183934 RepID=UPI003A840E2D